MQEAARRGKLTLVAKQLFDAGVIEIDWRQEVWVALLVQRRLVTGKQEVRDLIRMEAK